MRVLNISTLVAYSAEKKPTFKKATKGTALQMKTERQKIIPLWLPPVPKVQFLEYLSMDIHTDSTFLKHIHHYQYHYRCRVCNRMNTHSVLSLVHNSLEVRQHMMSLGYMNVRQHRYTAENQTEKKGKQDSSSKSSCTKLQWRFYAGFRETHMQNYVAAIQNKAKSESQRCLLTMLMITSCPFRGFVLGPQWGMAPIPYTLTIGFSRLEPPLVMLIHSTCETTRFQWQNLKYVRQPHIHLTTKFTLQLPNHLKEMQRNRLKRTSSHHIAIVQHVPGRR